MLVVICQFRDGSDLVLKCKNASFKGIIYSVNVVDCCPGNAKNGLSESVDFKIFWGSNCPQTPLAVSISKYFSDGCVVVVCLGERQAVNSIR